MSNAYDVVRQFESEIAEFAGSKYAVSVESCTAALFLSLLYRRIQGETITIPKFTYPSVANSIIHAGGQVAFSDRDWSGVYELEPVGVIDGALRFSRGMYKGGLHCLSFHSKKLLPIGRGGMILTDDEYAYKWLKKMRFDGREEGVPIAEDELEYVGWNMYMTPEQAARGLVLFDHIKDKEIEDLDSHAQGYPDLSKTRLANWYPV
jgi:dTDP-4-amino-4,6-dideoxygalactose transaminase